MTLQGKRVAILIEDLYQDQEVWYPYYRLREAGAEVICVGTGKKEYKSKHGYPIQAEAAAHEVSAAEMEGLVIPGGYAPDLLRRHEAILRLVREADEQGKIIGAICHAGWVLCSAGILRGKTVTCFVAIRDDVINAGATYVDQEVVRDGHLITARQPDDLPAFLRAFIDALGERPSGAVRPGHAAGAGRRSTRAAAATRGARETSPRRRGRVVAASRR